MHRGHALQTAYEKWYECLPVEGKIFLDDVNILNDREKRWSVDWQQ